MAWVKGHYNEKDRELKHIINAEANRPAHSYWKDNQYSLPGIISLSCPAFLSLDYPVTSSWHNDVLDRAHSDTLQNTILKWSSWIANFTRWTDLLCNGAYLSCL
jgi:hypothetical protein